MSRKIMITGGHGFIGSNLSRALVDSGHTVVRFGRGKHISITDARVENVYAELSDTTSLAKSLQDCEVVFHKASKCPSGTISNGESLFEANVESTRSLITAIELGGTCVRHVLLDSSISVYGEGCYQCGSCGMVRPHLRTRESVTKNMTFEPVCPNCASAVFPCETVESAELNGESAYARSKKIQEDLLISAAGRLGFKLTILRYATVYGGGQSAANTYGRLLRAISTGQSITINEDGLQKRDFIHVDDVIASNLSALERNSTEQLTLNIGSAVETALSDFVRQAIEFACATRGEHSAVSLSSSLSPGDVRHCKIDCGRALSELGFRANISLADGLSRTINSTPHSLV